MKNNKDNYVDQEIKKMIKKQREEKKNLEEKDEKRFINKLPYLIGIFMVISILLGLFLRVLNLI
ncbi:MULTISPECIES: hypothetical protein [Aerococcus]|uniref:hypothetical protein n=1 Tax=Aerococcus TaxID=1375 RepID=UPI000DCE1CF3|nr:hypothetical protein [Aerococcus urinae]MDK7303540.1 hypothetical protein [Aerococcus urinae]RAV71605.1 hypothetical protein DBT40_04680 [Aerococcus urinae]RAW04987.1 hypothetical protein DBT41_03875 [Aerococcus urinae]